MRHRILPLYKRNKLRDYSNSNVCRYPFLNFKQLAKFCETWKGDVPLEDFLNSVQLTIKTWRSHKMPRRERLSFLQQCFTDKVQYSARIR